MEIHKKKVETQSKLALVGEETKRHEENRRGQMDRDAQNAQQQGKVLGGEVGRAMRDGVQRNLEQHELALEKERVKKSVANEKNND